MELTLDTKVKLNNGIDMPMLGIGVWDMSAGKETLNALKWAFEVGYRHVDTAKLYGNERQVGEAVRKSGIPREELFVVTKLWNNDHGYKKALAAFDASLKRMGLDFVDLYLIHWPEPGVRDKSWRALEKIYDDGRARAIGVSNYTIRHLEEVLEIGTVVPAVNQVEFHPWLFQEDLLKFCRSKSIALEAYSPLTKGKKLRDRALGKMAKKYSRSPAQILIRWALQHEVIVIPKSSNKKRIRENANIYDFSISDEDMRTLDAFNRDMHITWDPTDEP
jgi:diketogulonate reductase-like aldo/keto reductase